MRTEEIYHQGEEGAQRAGIKGAFSFLRVPGEPQLAFVRCRLRRLVVDILVPGSFAYPVIECNQSTCEKCGFPKEIHVFLRF
ncbi:MAG: hypothetical protein LBH51_00485 [Treponema sp.]|jgi:hypothetical protein|nr:hypothetical protein [Treponema sp.]